MTTIKGHGCNLFLGIEEGRRIRHLLRNQKVLIKCGLTQAKGLDNKIIEIITKWIAGHGGQRKSAPVPRGMSVTHKRSTPSSVTNIAIRGIPSDLFEALGLIAKELNTNMAGLIISMLRDFFASHGFKTSLKKPVKKNSNTRKSSDSLDQMLYEELKVLDHGFVRVMDYMGNDSSITQAARISYGEGTKQLTQDQGLINYLLRNNHTTPFEMCEIKLHIKMPIFIARQWVRHRMAHINEYSARYSILSSDFYAPAVEHICGQSKSNKQCRDYASQHKEAQKTRELIIQQSQDAYRTYMELIEPEEDSEDGIARELARTVLPVNFYTEMYWKIDLHNLMHFIALRNHPHAQFEIREYARILLDIVKEWVPMTYEAFMQYKTGSITVSKDIAGTVFSDLGDLDDVQKRIVDKNPAISKREVGEFVSYLKALKKE